MILRQLHLRHFRNYDALDIELDPQINEIVAENGKGKTNLIEAIYCLGLLKSFRTASDSEIVQFGHNYFSIHADLENELGVKHKEVIHYENKRKDVTVDGKRLSKHSALLGFLPVVLFVPEDHRITSGTPAERRKFIDILLSQADQRYLQSLQEYAKALKQRSKLLARLQEGRAAVSELDAWDLTLATAGHRLTTLRIEFLKEIATRLEQFYTIISNQQGLLQASYSPSDPKTTEGTDEYRQRLLALRSHEIQRQQTLIGPHRDDIRFYIDARDVRRHSSRGEQKSVLLALKLVEFQYLHEKAQTKPILLLDDIASELDAMRRKSFFDSIEEVGQTVVTTTSKQKLPAEACASFRIRDGGLVRLQFS